MSGLPPFWKIRREIKRAVAKLFHFPRIATIRYCSTPYYDYVLSRSVKHHAGEIPLGSRIAIYVIFPNQGLLQSHLMAIEHIVSSGYSPVVVSNLPLDQAALGKLRPLTSLTIERPNYGYDFGGYREGVLAVRDMLGSLDRLAILNDSSWFPLRETDNWLKDAEATGYDMAGAISHGGIVRFDADSIGQTPWDWSTERRSFHYCSFALSFGKKVLADPAFLTFWKGYPLTSMKNFTVRWGEIGLSRWIKASGYTHGTTCDLSGLATECAALDDRRFAVIFSRLIVLRERSYTKLFRKFDLDDPYRTASRKELTDFYLGAVGRIGASYAAAEYVINEKSFPFLKKSPLVADGQSSTATLAIANDLDGRIGETIRAEARDLATRLPAKHR